MKTRFELIEKNPPCLKCGKPAIYKLEKTRFFSYYDCKLCENCLREILIKTKKFIWSEK